MSEPLIRKPNTPGRAEDGFRLLQGKQEYVNYLEGSTFRYWYSDIAWRYEPHFHSAFEVVLAESGSVHYEVDKRKYEIQAGEIIIIPPGVEHSLSMDAFSSRHLFLFEPETIFAMADIKMLSKGFQQVFYLRDESRPHQQIRELLLQAVQVYKEQELMWNCTCFSLMLRMFVLLGQTYLSGLMPARQKTSSGSSEIVTGMMTYINNHYQEDLTLEMAAEAAGFSKFYFSRFFKAQTGYTFHDFLCQKRLQVAMDLLINTRKSMGEVAGESGFGSVATFNRLFREHKNCTPTQYRAIYGAY